MSTFMLNDEAAIDDVNPFVLHDFSLPGGVRQTGKFEDFQEVPKSKGIPEPTKSVFCDLALCEDEKTPCDIDKTLHPRRNIDYGLGCGKPKNKIKIGVSNRKIPWRLILIAVLIVLILLILRR
jgi:hypothetical protein